MKRTGIKTGLVLALVMALFWLPAAAQAFVAEMGSGTIGNISWKVINTDTIWTLHITGSGAIPNYSSPYAGCSGSQYAPWYSRVPYGDSGETINLGNYMEIEIGEGITSIGSYAFSPYTGGENSIQKLVIPDTVTSIGTGAFLYQGHLDYIVVPDSVKSIGENAFEKYKTTVVCEPGSAACEYCLRTGQKMSLSGLKFTITIDGKSSSALLPKGGQLTYKVTSNIAGIEPEVIMTGASLYSGLTHDPQSRTVTASADAWGNVALLASAHGATARIDIKVPRECSISYNLDGGTAPAGQPKTYTEGSTVKLKAPVRKGYLFKGWYLPKYDSNGGAVYTKVSKITSSMTGDLTLYAQWKSAKPGKPGGVTLTNKKTRKLVVSWKKVSGAKGYQLRYSTNSSFKKNVTKKTTKALKLTLSKLTKKKTYYVQVRAWKLDSTGAKCYGSWSKKAKIVIKK